MKIAVTYENGNIFPHFGRTEQVKLYHITDGQITAQAIVDTNGHGHGALAGFLQQYQVDVLICGGIGVGAQIALEEAGIKLYGGVSGNADAAVADFLAGKLDYDPDFQCDHHEGHDCGEHDCGEHNCAEGHC